MEQTPGKVTYIILSVVLKDNDFVYICGRKFKTKNFLLKTVEVRTFQIDDGVLHGMTSQSEVKNAYLVYICLHVLTTCIGTGVKRNK